MATYRVHKTKDYTVMSNTHLRDKNMSLKAKGLLSVMLSLPDDWDYSINGFCAICLENETSIKSALRELKDNGYLVIDKKMPNETSSGRIEYIYNVYEQPHLKQEVEKQGIENQPLEFQAVENHGQLSTYISSTYESSIKESNTDDNAARKKNINYVEIVDAYKEICISFPTIRHLSEARKKAIKARINSGYTQDDFITLFKKAQESDFLKGKNDRKWSADFDWLIKDANMAKVLDGKYDNRPTSGNNQYNYSYGEEGVDYL